MQTAAVSAKFILNALILFLLVPRCIRKRNHSLFCLIFILSSNKPGIIPGFVLSSFLFLYVKYRNLVLFLLFPRNLRTKRHPLLQILFISSSTIKNRNHSHAVSFLPSSHRVYNLPSSVIIPCLVSFVYLYLSVKNKNKHLLRFTFILFSRSKKHESSPPNLFQFRSFLTVQIKKSSPIPFYVRSRNHRLICFIFCHLPPDTNVEIIPRLRFIFTLFPQLQCRKRNAINPTKS